MKIAIFSDNFYPELSGISDSLVFFAQGLAANGHQVLFVAPRYRAHDYPPKAPHELDLGPAIQTARLWSIRYPYSPTGQSRITVPCGRGIALLKKFFPDVIHTNSPFGAGIEALLAAKFLRVPLVGTNHTLISEFINHSPLNFFWLTRVTLRYFSGYYNNCAYVTAPCRSLLEEMENYGLRVPHQPVPNPIDAQRFVPVASAAKKAVLQKRFQLTGKTILYTGRLAPEKCIDVIIRAFAQLQKKIPDTTLLIAGHGSAEQSLRALTQKLGVAAQVHFVGFVDKDTLPLLYQASDLFVIMSTSESQSLSLMQAMASALPSIGARARALPEYIDEASGLLVKPGDVPALAGAMQTILSDDALAGRLGAGGLKSVQRCARPAIVKIFEKIYTEAA
jgi:glycosyltransferase involved in cell wall biosynthesis